MDILGFHNIKRDVALVAIIHIRDAFKDDTSSGDARNINDNSLRQSFSKLRAELEQVLPRHIVRTVYIPLSQLLLIAGGRVNRKALKVRGETLDIKQLLSYSLSGNKALKPPSSTIERRLQRL